ncbi:hypothetical protein PSU4_38480 [Pseudonocardia sulfidoxydans NBRC 16205]|uniref:Uncharacterized protein n=1 Tax=Pseudonocardia sulfidoxydans NBRC 16205 TaxID=1223511 RepID=A0A511DM73_9PSEU|nr:hypothetical protein [Pseudonocardia sulfidoxydans]GEL24894.1 hypothetical protein PSU4_38480 [Pseudonocardia sulfidoxydans NBRC 16205]
MLDPAELQDVASTFGVAESQVARDHLISHMLAAISEQLPDDVVFFGGPHLLAALFQMAACPRTSIYWLHATAPRPPHA